MIRHVSNNGHLEIMILSTDQKSGSFTLCLTSKSGPVSQKKRKKKPSITR